MKQQGFGTKRIAKILKVSRNTVRKYLCSSSLPQYKKEVIREKKITPYEDSVKEMFSKGYIETRIFNEIKVLGYCGSLDMVHRYLRKLKGQDEKLTLSTTRVETFPGEQMQYDWKEWSLSIGESFVKTHVHGVILSYSRKKYYSFSVTITQEDIIRAIEEAVLFFGGCAREILIDNPKAMVISHTKGGIVYFNESFLKFCGLYGIEPIACSPYRARTKGKIERTFYTLEEHFLKGLKVESLSEFGAKLKDFTRLVN